MRRQGDDSLICGDRKTVRYWQSSCRECKQAVQTGVGDRIIEGNSRSNIERLVEGPGMGIEGLILAGCTLEPQNNQRLWTLLRLILLCDEFIQLTRAGLLREAWEGRLRGWAERLTASCRAVDLHSTDQTLAESPSASGGN